ncbi:hypothetical protein QJS10_CPA03g02123 [Acorus calamus]|uniref:Uncharacterized protein n=1 Tax=Acorus calamus TaxID=4465 RepID=A0AAV9F3X3_ACOCL|nr:hypothetical protein QJS10_CPA03g02123 [Acorus calamus]
MSSPTPSLSSPTGTTMTTPRVPGITLERTPAMEGSAGHSYLMNIVAGFASRRPRKVEQLKWMYDTERRPTAPLPGKTSGTCGASSPSPTMRSNRPSSPTSKTGTPPPSKASAPPPPNTTQTLPSTSPPSQATTGRGR